LKHIFTASFTSWWSPKLGRFISGQNEDLSYSFVCFSRNFIIVDAVIGANSSSFAINACFF
jgi:hypothetical protein